LQKNSETESGQTHLSARVLPARQSSAAWFTNARCPSNAECLSL